MQRHISLSRLTSGCVQLDDGGVRAASIQKKDYPAPWWTAGKSISFNYEKAHGVYISHGGKRKVKSQSLQPLSKPCTAVFVKWDSKLDEPEEFSSSHFLPRLFIRLDLTRLKGLQSKAPQRKMKPLGRWGNSSILRKKAVRDLRFSGRGSGWQVMIFLSYCISRIT